MALSGRGVIDGNERGPGRHAAFHHAHMPSALTLALEQTTFHSLGMTSSSFPLYRPSIKHLPWG